MFVVRLFGSVAHIGSVVVLLDADRVGVATEGDAGDGAGGWIDYVQGVLVFTDGEDPTAIAATAFPLGE